jgi:hypothetical protein
MVTIINGSYDKKKVDGVKNFYTVKVYKLNLEYVI